MISPHPALVKPRVVSWETNETIPLDDVIASCAERQPAGAIELIGGRGSGKTTALAHLASLSCADALLLIDDAEEGAVPVGRSNRLVVYTTRRTHNLTQARYRLAAWCDDDLIEYLLAMHPDRCASVMARFTADPDKVSLAGAPRLYRLVADQMAAGDEVKDIRTALRRGVAEIVGDERNLRKVQLYAASVLFIEIAQPPDPPRRTIRRLTRLINHARKRSAKREQLGFLGNRLVKVLLAADHIIAGLTRNSKNPFPPHRLPRDLVLEVGTLARGNPPALDRLREFAQSGNTVEFPMVASVLHAADPHWRPEPGRLLHLSEAYLMLADWDGINLSASFLDRADLHGAQFQNSDLRNLRLKSANLCGCFMAQSIMYAVQAQEANFCGANLTGAKLNAGNFFHTDFSHSILDRVCATRAKFRLADFAGASLRCAELRECNFQAANLSGADLSGADFRESFLSELSLRNANLKDANFSRANLSRSDLEFVELPRARFRKASLSGALLTGSIMPAADLREADLTNAGLADIDWEQADLRGADLRGCSFHMGSSRSGLVGSPYPGHGSRTGFYTDEYGEQNYKAPEEIRKANLRGADLRGAIIDDTDFYLVDLRDAKYGPEQEQQFRRCNAILSDYAV